jgi:hypothetical protein
MRAVTPRNIARLPGLLDQATRAVTPEVGANLIADFSPGLGDWRALKEVPGLLSEGRIGDATVAGLSALPIAGLLGDVARASRPAQRELQALQNRFTREIRAANAAGDTRRSAELTRQMIEARPGGFARVQARLDAPIKKGEGSFTLVNDVGEEIPGRVSVKVGEGGIVDVAMPVTDAALAGQQQLGRVGVRESGRQIIEALEAAGHEVTALSGFRASGARSQGLLSTAESTLSVPREFFFR